MPRSALPQASEKSKTSAEKMFPTHSLMEQPLFRNRNRILGLSPADRIQLSFARAREVISAYGINIADLQDVSSRVWRMHCDPIWSLDGAAGTIATIHVNLVMGTLAKFQHQPCVSQLLQKMFNFEVNGQYCLTELGHGLDVFALETRVDLTTEGDFRLNTPNPRAAKYMPPTTPCGYPVTAVVFARLFVRGHDHGIKPFIVPIHDGTCMYQGVSSTALHLRGGSNPVLHALTSFRNVRLPSTALLGSIDPAADQKIAFFAQIDRVVSGTLVMGGLAAMGVGMSASIVSAYSHRRHVSDPVTGKPIPIISFPTQITPILTAVAQSHVLHAYGESTRQQFGRTETITQRHFLAAVWKVTAARMAMASMQVLIDRCGAQGLFEINQLTTMLADLRGSAVAEGDIQALAIRFAVDVLLGRVEMPDPVDDSSLLARHEQGVLTELLGVLAGLKNPRREMAAVVLPQAFRIIESIGHRMAVDAARHAGVDCRLIAVFEAGVIHCDPAWYSENGISHVEQARIEREAIETAAPALQDFVHDLGMEGHIQAPIVSDEKWEEYVSQLDTFEAPAVGHQQTSEDRLAPVWGGSQIQFTAAKL